MTKRNPFNTCRYCGTEFRKTYTKQLICSPQCALWSRVDKSGSCWNWTAGAHYAGYGQLSFNGVAVRAHRFSYELHNGPIPDGLFVMHKCDNPRCVRPSHLQLGTANDNIQDKARKGRNGNGRIKLDLESAASVKMMIRMGHTDVAIAMAHQIDPASVWCIRQDRYWRHVPWPNPPQNP